MNPQDPVYFLRTLDLEGSSFDDVAFRDDIVKITFFYSLKNSIPFEMPEGIHDISDKHLLISLLFYEVELKSMVNKFGNRIRLEESNFSLLRNRNVEYFGVKKMDRGEYYVVINASEVGVVDFSFRKMKYEHSLFKWMKSGGYVNIEMGETSR